jgi:hypothetical protein
VNELLIYGGASFAFAAGYAFRALTAKPLGDPDWRTVAVNKEKLATDNWNRFVDACKECNAIADSNARLASALAAKKDRLNRIVEAFADQKSGTAQRAVKLARGDA